jgi:hypothetical protein
LAPTERPRLAEDSSRAARRAALTTGGWWPEEPLDQARGLTFIASIMWRSYALHDAAST